MKEHTALFIGHGECYGVGQEEIKDALRRLISMGVTDFLCGGMGGFDWKCARAIYELKAEYPSLRSFLVIPYLTFNIQNRELFDDIIYPQGFEKYHFKAAIIQRNRYMVRNATYAICYITHGWGGAVKTYEYAKREWLYLLNLGRYD